MVGNDTDPLVIYIINNYNAFISFINNIPTTKTMKNIPTNVLRSFVTVVDLGGYTQAAELLGRSQPAISLQIKRLEELVEEKLFSRNKQKLELTAAGQRLLTHARRLLQLNDEIIREFTKPVMSGRIHLGIPSEFATTLLPKIVGRFAKAYPDVTLEVTSALSKQLLSEPLKRGFDLILALHDKPTTKKQGHIKTEELVWVSSHGHSAHESDKVLLIAAPEGCIYRKRAIKQLRLHKIPWQMVYTNPDLNGIQAAIEEGLGVTALAKSTVPEGLDIIKASEQLPSLGTLGISLSFPHKQSSDASVRLGEFIKASLV
jgi:DNA-binding transcriptional LysR family regulator